MTSRSIARPIRPLRSFTALLTTFSRATSSYTRRSRRIVIRRRPVRTGHATPLTGRIALTAPKIAVRARNSLAVSRAPKGARLTKQKGGHREVPAFFVCRQFGEVIADHFVLGG